jgi:anaerobic ribonucleoside-triphosphate reductase
MTEVNPNTKLKELLFKQTNIATEAKFKDNEKAHEILNDFLKKLSDRIEKDEEITAKRLNNLEVFVTTELVGPKSLEYKPPGYEEYLGLGQTLNLIFEKLNRIEASLGL